MQSDSLEFAIDVAQRAGSKLLTYHRQSMDAMWTGRNHFKTQADEEIDILAHTMVNLRYPDHGWYSEEGGFRWEGSADCWVVDALDGTINFLTGWSDHFAFCIAHCFASYADIGVVNAPLRKEFYAAEKGKGAFLNGKPISVSPLTEINKVLMWIGSGKHNRDAHIPYLKRLMQPDGVALPMTTGCASVPLCLVASGVIHAFLATSLSPEDMAAAVVIIREAGGKVTNLNGDEWTLRDPSILAANPSLHEQLMELLKNEKEVICKSSW